ncbi:AraC family transcriptional regulator ligand-binding domain-containing protein [Luminiphilus sp. nBUS_16]|uniref:AraC family transcriptional regulator n=1 Tax=Luminiphilus sp. nBUS_16 TaxID=3395315 RepID=UPI003EC0659C
MISAHYARLLHRELKIRGHDDAALFRGCAINSEALWQLAKLEPSDFLKLLANAQEMLGDKQLGSLVTSRNGLATLGMMGVAMMSAPTLGAGLQAMSSYSTLEADYLHFELLAGQRVTRITLETDRDLGDSLLIHAETVFALLQDYLRDLVGSAEGTITFKIAYPALKREAPMAIPLLGKLSYDCRFTGLEFPTHWLNTRSPFSNPEVWQLSRRHLSEQLQLASSPGDQPFTRHLRSVMQSQRPPLPDINDLAESLHLSPRTLSRRLMEEQTTFRELKLRAVHDCAKNMLLDGASVEAVAAELGYENAANFRRSFRAVNLCSPTQWMKSFRQGTAASI